MGRGRGGECHGHRTLHTHRKTLRLILREAGPWPLRKLSNGFWCLLSQLEPHAHLFYQRFPSVLAILNVLQNQYYKFS